MREEVYVYAMSTSFRKRNRRVQEGVDRVLLLVEGDGFGVGDWAVYFYFLCVCVLFCFLFFVVCFLFFVFFCVCVCVCGRRERCAPMFCVFRLGVNDGLILLMH